MSFLYPEYLKLLGLLLVLLPLWVFRTLSIRETRLRLGARRALRNVSRLSSAGRESLRFFLLSLALSALILALAHPQLKREKQEPMPIALDMVFLLDTSPSMRARDLQPSRLGRALELIAALSQRKKSQDRMALVSFAEGSLILSYLTEDSNNILYYLDYLKNDDAIRMGTNMARGLANGLDIILKDKEKNPQAEKHKRLFILISDGEDHGQELESAVREMRRSGIKVHTIGVGSREGAPVPLGEVDGKTQYLEDVQGRRIISRFDERPLRRIAENTGGRSYRSFTGDDLEKSISDIVFRESEIAGFKKITERTDLYHEVLLAAFGFFVAAIIL